MLPHHAIDGGAGNHQWWQDAFGRVAGNNAPHASFGVWTPHIRRHYIRANPVIEIGLLESMKPMAGPTMGGLKSTSRRTGRLEARWR